MHIFQWMIYHSGQYYHIICQMHKLSHVWRSGRGQSRSVCWQPLYFLVLPMSLIFFTWFRGYIVWGGNHPHHPPPWIRPCSPVTVTLVTLVCHGALWYDVSVVMALYCVRKYTIVYLRPFLVVSVRHGSCRPPSAGVETSVFGVKQCHGGKK